MKGGHIGGTKALLARLGDEVFAIGATCSHLGGPLHQGLVVDHSVRCPWHHACFSLCSGQPLAAPAFDPLPHWEVTVEDSFVRVRIQLPFRHPHASGITQDPMSASLSSAAARRVSPQSMCCCEAVLLARSR